MRRSDREIKEFDDIVSIMEKCDVCRIALNDEEYPYILPLNFGMEVMEGQITLYFHGAMEGKKYDLISRNPKAGFEMDCSHKLILDKESCNCTMEYESLIGQGIMEVIEEGDEKLKALTILMEHYHPGGTFSFDPRVMSKTKAFKLIVSDINGKARIKN